MASKIRSSTGGVKTDALPESPIFRNTERVEAVFEVRHMNGKPIPDELRELIPYGNTDEGIAERLAKPHASARVTSDPLSKKILERRDFRVNEMEHWEAPDPMKELTAEHVPAGMRPRFLSDTVNRRRGMRHFEAVKGPNGDPVKFGNMVLGVMPEALAVKLERRYQELGNAKMAEIRDDFNEKQEQLTSSAARRSRAARGEPGLDGLQEVRGNAADVELLR